MFWVYAGIINQFRQELDLHAEKSTAKPNVFRDGYRAYIDANNESVKSKGSLKSQKWSELPQVEKDRWAKTAKESQSASCIRTDQHEMPTMTPGDMHAKLPFKFSDDWYAIGSNNITAKTYANNVASLSAVRCNRTKNVITPNRDEIPTTKQSLCCESVGPGMRTSDFTSLDWDITKRLHALLFGCSLWENSGFLFSPLLLHLSEPGQWPIVSCGASPGQCRPGTDISMRAPRR